MATYRLSPSGEEVHHIQEQLRALGLYRGLLDGNFGGGTEAADPRRVEDVRTRKPCIAKGHGVVHGVRYDLAEQLGIGLEV